MSQRKQHHKKPTRIRKTQTKPDRSGYVAMKHPLSTLPRETVLKVLVEVGKKQHIEFPKRLAEVEATLNSLDPLSTISVLATYGLMGFIGSQGNVGSLYKGEVFNQSHVELIQALCLRIPIDRLPHEHPTPTGIQRLFDLLPELADAYSHRRLARLEEEHSEESKAVMLIQDGLRLHTQVVRNWGFLSRVQKS